MGQVSSYNAKDVSVVWNHYFITGFGEDMASGSKDEEFFSTSVGAQGDVVINEVNNDLGTVTITVQPTCPQRAQLIADAKAGVVAPLFVNNKSQGKSYGGNQARIKNYPEETLGNEAEDLEFEFQVFDYTVN